MTSAKKVQLAASQLVIIDIQTKLSLAMPSAQMLQVIKNAQILIQAATLLSQPILVTEQYPQGLGPTHENLLAQLNSQVIQKMTFSACGEPKFIQQLSRDKPQIVLTGMEAHICVLQTALDLAVMGKQVFVVEDAIISRSANNLNNALARMRDAGCVITNTESVVFECLGTAEHESFKAIARLIK